LAGAAALPCRDGEKFFVTRTRDKREAAETGFFEKVSGLNEVLRFAGVE
jgi:hypothetical protein